jgi:hypothetical protein
VLALFDLTAEVTATLGLTLNVPPIGFTKTYE